MTTMKAIKKEKAGRGVVVTTAPVPVPSPNEVLIKVKTAGICGTDLHIYKWDKWSENRTKPPFIPGHEFVGEICELGGNVSGLRIGQRVSAEGHITCGHCRYCKSGQGHICQDVEIIGVDRNGCFTEYVAIPQENIWPVHEDIPDRHAALFDPLGNAMHTVMAQPISMKTILITGAGSIGLFAIPIAKSNGAEKVIVIEPNEFKRNIASQIGADLIFDSADADIKQKILDYTEGVGPDVLLEMSGNSGALHLGLDLLANGGAVSLLGIPANDVPLNLAEEIIFKGITVRGITGRRMYETWFQCQSFLLKSGGMIDPIITHSMDLKDIETGFRLMEENKAAKVLLTLN